MHPLLNRDQTSQAPGAFTVEYPRGSDLHKYATAEECAAKIYKTTVCHFGFVEKVYKTVLESIHRNGDSHLQRRKQRNL